MWLSSLRGLGVADARAEDRFRGLRRAEFDYFLVTSLSGIFSLDSVVGWLLSILYYTCRLQRKHGRRRRFLLIIYLFFWVDWGGLVRFRNVA